MADTKLAKVGITVKESWKDDISYEVLDYTLWRVQDGGDGCGYIAKRANIGVVPNSDDSVWIKATQAGQSIYDLAVKYGHFVGTEEEFEAEYQAALQAARDAASETSATNAEIQEAEELRRASEDERADAEAARQESEIAREATESDRQIAENMRQMAETQRGENETTRQSQETARESSETQRQSNESTRQSNETARESAEQERTADFEALKTDMETAIGEADAATAAAVALNNQVAGDESARQQAEQSRVASETQRQTAETQRGTNEQTRQTQETARQTAESTRNTQETARQTAEGQRATAEQGRASAESGRVSAETSRVAAETARETQATTDHQRADSDHAIAEEDHATLDEKISHKADIDGSYDGMAVGIARNLEGRTDVTDSFFERTTGGDAEVANGTAQLNEVKGKSQVWNQLAKTFENADVKPSPSNSDFSYNGAVNTATFWKKQAPFRWNIGFSQRYGHKIFVSFEHSNDENTHLTYQLGSNSSSANVGKVAKILSYASSSSALYNDYISIYSSTVDLTNVTIKNFIAVDLTAIFGAGNEPATEEEVEAWLAENIGEQAYYPYNAGEVLNNRMTGVESVGFNLLDPATGKADIIGAYSDVYGNYYGITGTHGTLTFTDKFGNTETITPDEDGKFLLEKAGTLSVADAGEDCAVFLWWDGTQTEFKQYEKNVGALDVTHIYGKLNGEGDYVLVWPTGMPGIGDIKDSLKVVDGQVVAERKVGEVDMGTITWGRYDSLQSNVIYRSNSFLTKVDAAGICHKYQNKANTTPPFLGVGEMKIGTRYWSINPYVAICDNGYETAEAFKAAMSGVLLYYELATPKVFTDLIYRDSESFADNTPVTLPVNYKVDNWGIERIAPQNTEEAVVTAKPELTMRYSIDAVEELNTHRDEIDDLYEKNEELDERKPEKYGEYPDMAVGSAKNIAGDLATDAEFKFRKTGGNDAVASGLAKLTAVYGKSLVWNQTIDQRVGTYTLSGITAVFGEDGYVTLSGTATAEAHIMLMDYYGSCVIGHKYLLLYGGNIALSDDIQIGNNFLASPFRWQESAIVTATFNRSAPKIVVANGATVSGKFALGIIDLTLMFGAGNEPATVAEFEAMFPLPYYDYNAGEIVSNKAEAIETVGFNQLNLVGREEYSRSSDPNTDYGFLTDKMVIKGWSLNGYIYAFNIDSYSLSENEVVVKTASGASTPSYGIGIPFYVFPNKEYHIRFDKVGNDAKFGFTWIDGNGKVISYVAFNDTTKTSGVAVSPANAKLAVLGLRPGAQSTTATWRNICINLSDASRNGEYEPYRKYTLPLNIPTLTGKLNGEGESVVIVPEGLKSAGSVRDELVIKNGYATSIIKMVGKYVFTGEEDTQVANWRPYEGSFAALFPYAMIDGFANPSMTVMPNIVFVGADAKPYNNIYLGENGASLFAGGQNTYSFVIRVPSSQATDKASLIAWLAGRTIYYELDTPEEYILDEPFYVGYQEDANGTEKRLPEDTAESVMPALPCKIAYPIDVVKAINELGDIYVPRSEWAKWGVVSQTQTWSGSGTNPRTYTMSNKVMGWVPNSNIDLYEAAGAVYNPTTGYFELNGLTDISYAEMKAIYALTTPSRDEVNKAYLFAYNRRVRTIFPTTQADRLCGSYIATTGYVKLFYTATQTNIEVFALLPANSTGKVIVDEIRSMLSNNYVVKNVIGILNVAQVALMASTFANTYSLESVSLFGLKVDVSFAQSPNLTLASVVFAVQNCATIPAGGITITLHATAFARCQADTTEYTYNEQTYTGIIALAAAKNITIQSA